MKILIDAGKLKHPHNGLDTFLREYIKQLEIQQNDYRAEIHLLLPRAKIENFNTTLPCIQQKSFKVLQAKTLCRQFDLWHSPFHTMNRMPSQRKHCIQVATVHDFNPVYEKPHKKTRYLDKSLKHLYSADYITCVSKFSHNDLRALHPELSHIPSKVIYNGVSAPDDKPESPAHIPPKLFLFSLGAFMKKKNYACIIRMMAHVKEAHLVIAGSSKKNGSYMDELRAIAQEEGVSKRLSLLSNISESDKNWYLRHCAAFLFPSKLEGFGIPPAEAMICGKTPFIFESTSVPEVVGAAGKYWADESPEEMAALVNEFIQSNAYQSVKTIQKNLSQAQLFSWEKMTRSYLELFQQLTKK